MKFPKKIVVSGIILMLLTGCSNVLERQTAKMDDYRANLDQERLMAEKERESHYKKQLWYNPALWKSQNHHNLNSKAEEKQRTQDFFACVHAAEEIEKGISEQIGGRDPIQTSHARATIEVCMISKKYQAIDSGSTLICESPDSDVLPICTFSQDAVLDYRGWG